MSNIVPHLRHNRHHTLLLKQEQPCSQFDLYLHDQQPLNYRLLEISHSSSKDYSLAFTSLQHALFIGFTIGKNINKWCPKNGYRSMQIIVYKSCESRDFVIVDYQVGLLVDYKSEFILSLVKFQIPSYRPLVI
jgi:hypothetical protein